MPNSIISQKQDGQELFNTISSFFSSFKIGNLLRKCNAQKEKGIPVIDIFKYKLYNVFSGRSMYMQQKTGSYREKFSKNTFYRFLNSTKTNWLRFTSLLSKEVADTIEPLTSEDRVNAFIVDDSLFERTSCKKTELGSRVFDHSTMRHCLGYWLMTVGWTDGNTFLPVNSCLLASGQEKNILGPEKHFDGRSLAAKRRGRSKYLLSVDVMVGKEKKIPAKIVCVCNKKKKKDWVAFICTDTTLSEEEIIRIYGKRWKIEVFFKACKSLLNLTGECHSLSYDALTAHTAIVFTRYLMIALEQRRNEDDRTLGEIFFYFTDELADITFGESFQIIITAMIESIYTVFQITEEQMDAFIEMFVDRLPEYLQESLIRSTQYR